MGTRVFPAVTSGLPTAILLSAVLCAPIAAQDASPAQVASVDSIFRRFDGSKTVVALSRTSTSNYGHMFITVKSVWQATYRPRLAFSTRRG